MKSPRIEYTTIGQDSAHPLTIPRIITGLWQLAGGHDSKVDMLGAVREMEKLVERGLTGFDMADHYGPAELVIGAYRSAHQSPIQAFTKWCPKPGPTSLKIVEEAVNLALSRMGQKSLDLLQYHIWKYEDSNYLINLYHLASLRSSGKIRLLGLTNTDLPHLQLLAASGFTIATNQVSISLLDRRVEKGEMGKWCAENGVGLLGYGTLLGGFVSEKWVGRPEPGEGELKNWSLKKYKRFIDVACGWDAFQLVLGVVDGIAKGHAVPMSAVAIRHSLDIPGVSAVIVGSRLNSSSLKHTDASLAAFSFSLDEDDRRRIAEAQEGLEDVPGDCGDEYRRPPFLTAAGDLSDHLSDSEDRLKRVDEVIRKGGRVEFSSSSVWEPIAGYCRAVRFGNTITISGTTATSLPSSKIIGGSSASAQTTHIFDIISSAINALGGSLRDVTRTRIILQDVEDCDEVVEVHGRVFGREEVRPANTTSGGAKLVGEEMKVEIEVDAVIGAGGGEVLRI